MSWGHIVVEAYCIFNGEETLKPNCCKYRPGITGSYCLTYDNSQHVYCPYLGFTNARSSLILTDKNGDAVASEIFYCDEVDEIKWLEVEQKWIKKWKCKLEKEIE